jgi:membrane protein required for beta-lactamase induction
MTNLGDHNGGNDMNRFLRILKFSVIGVLILTLLSFVVMRLWNWLTPTLFGWHVITFWQALGVLASSHDGTLGAHDPRRAREVS